MSRESARIHFSTHLRTGAVRGCGNSKARATSENAARYTSIRYRIGMKMLNGLITPSRPTTDEQTAPAVQLALSRWVVSPLAMRCASTIATAACSFAKSVTTAQSNLRLSASSVSAMFFCAPATASVHAFGFASPSSFGISGSRLEDLEESSMARGTPPTAQNQ